MPRVVSPATRRTRRALRGALGVFLAAILLGALVQALSLWRAGSPPGDAVPAASAEPTPTPAGPASPAPASSTAPPGDPATVRHVSDGDTFVALRDADAAVVTIRLLNVDAPETVAPGSPVGCGGPEAAAWLRARLPVGSRVFLAYDVGRRDRYGRDLAWVRTPDGRAVNLELVEAGLAYAVRIEPNHAHFPDTLAAEQRARTNGRGLFAPDSPCRAAGPASRAPLSSASTS